MKFLPVILTSALLLTTTIANSALLSPLVTNSTGSVQNSTAFSDGYIPNETGQWSVNTSWWYGTTSPYLTLDLGAIFNIEDILVSVDNNDNYSIEWSADSHSWTNLFNIHSSDGESGYGMDTMSSLSASAEYISALDFSPVQAQFLRIFATSGDGAYSVGELQAFGSKVSAVPIPAAAFLFAPALLGFMGLRRKAKNTVA